MKLFTPTFRISIGLAALTMSLVACAYTFGLVPDERKGELDARAKISEALAIQLSVAASRYDVTAVQETISSIVKRSSAVLSIALRRINGNILATAGDHDRHWIEPEDNRSTDTHVQVELFNTDTAWGKVEIAFRPLASAGHIAGFPVALASLMGFIGVLGFAGYYFVLRRALRELDPSRVIPERVQAAFDTLAEGVIILDEREAILLANKSFCQTTSESSKALFGRKISDLRWRQWSETAAIGDNPWRLAIRDNQPATSIPMSLRLGSEDIRNFMVNATSIVDGKGVICGAIVTFDDVTALEQKNEDLIQSVRQLEQSKEEISQRNNELRYLAHHDPLTGCLNRRAFFQAFESSLEFSRREKQPLSCLMVDLDHFKSINDRFGHATGDNVISCMASILKSSCRDEDLVGRYGGEEFCVVLVGSSLEQSMQIAEQIREDVATKSRTWLPAGQLVTTSIGVAALPDEPCAAMDLVNWADEALYAAKTAGRDRVVRWDETPQDTNAAHADQSPGRRSSDQPDTAVLDRSHEDEATSSAVVPSAQTAGLPSLISQSSIDPLTRLPTPVIFMDRVSQSITRAERNRKIVAVLHVSINSYERCTDAFGDATGNELIAAVGARLSAVLRQSDTVSLVGGGDRVPTISRMNKDKFAIEVSDLEKTSMVTWIIKRVFDNLSQPISLSSQSIHVTCSIGVSLYPGDGTNAETLVRHASTAERNARESLGTDSHKFFSQSMNESSRRQVMLETGIQQALEHNQFSLHYQPIVEARTGRIAAAEALLRCHSEDLRDVPIGMLVSIAEQSSQMSRIGEWVLRTAVRQLQMWIDDGLDLPRISVNLSAIQLRDSEAAERFLQIVTEMDLEPRKLQVEITETAMLEDFEAAGKTLKRLQRLGVQVALDDFGTGQSSLTYLRRFQADVLKIDRSFIDQICTSHSDVTLVSAIGAMSQQMGLRVVAEGVETTSQLDCLRDLGCDEIQGFLIAKPMPATAMSDWLKLFGAKGVAELMDGRQLKFQTNSLDAVCC
ncbi:MAG: diguanylate cyclase domain-containing protein, partial [Geminicoccaceae bacterium]